MREEQSKDSLVRTRIRGQELGFAEAITRSLDYVRSLAMDNQIILNATEALREANGNMSNEQNEQLKAIEDAAKRSAKTIRDYTALAQRRISRAGS